MFLHSLEIKNYRSLEDIKLDNLDHFNVLIGRNNSGKSTIFGGLSLLNGVIQGAVPIDWATALTGQRTDRSLELHLVFEPRQEDREQFIGLLCAAGQSEE